jgi:hypothetical protein
VRSNASSFRILLFSLFLIPLLFFPGNASAQYEVTVSLNGTWGFTPSGSGYNTLEVPGFWVWEIQPSGGFNFGTEDGPVWKIFEGIAEGTYQKWFDIPESMAGKRKFIHFEGVNHYAKVYVNGLYVGEHKGGFLPFELDITGTAYTPSTSNQLIVEMIYWDPDLIETSTNLLLWPAGSFTHSQNCGLVNDVWLVARPSLYAADCFVQTSYRNMTIDCSCAVINAGDSPETALITMDIYDDTGITLIKSLPSQQVTVQAGDTLSVNAMQSWPNPELWFPDNPVLYTMKIGIEQESAKINELSQKFGFREIWIESTQFRLNGIRLNLRGDNVDFHSLKENWSYLIPTRETWPPILDSLIALNFNVVRFHKEPVFSWMLDLCDERGMMVIDESAVHGVFDEDSGLPKYNPTYTANAVSWCRDWVRRDRNHPSVIMYSASNEAFLITHKILADDVKQLGTAIMDMDTTRPILYEGDRDLEGFAKVYSYHYMLGFPSNWPSGGIYNGMQEFVEDDLPTSWGEFDWNRHTMTRTRWARRQALKTRGARVLDVADVRPYRLDWSWHPNPAYTVELYDSWTPTNAEKQFLRNSMNAMLVFDKHYYEYTEFPYPYPEYNEGSTIERTLVIFNDEFSGESVDIRWRVLLAGTETSSGSFTVDVPLGAHVEETLSVPAPYVSANTNFSLELSSWKSGKQKFLESTTYRSKDTGLSPPASPANVSIEAYQSGARITWSPVTKNQDGNSTTINDYIIHVCGDCFFDAENTSTYNLSSNTSYQDPLSGIAGNPSENRFYRITAVDHSGLVSLPSVIVGTYDFVLTASPPYRFNSIALPVVIASVEDAEGLRQAVPFATSISEWSSSAQGYAQYLPYLPGSNFSVQPGKAYFATVTQASTLSLFGAAVFPDYLLTKYSGPSFHALMLPLDRPWLESASDILADIPNCDGVAYWNSSLQGYEQYIPDIPETDFFIQAGQPCFVSVSQTTAWPGNGAAQSAAKTTIPSVMNSGKAPHSVWGRFTSNSDFQAPVHFSAYIKSRPQEIVHAGTAGNRILNGSWIVQCAAFPSAWSAGDTLCIKFTVNGIESGNVSAVLSNAPCDRADDACLESELVPSVFGLGLNYPNPFNGATRFSYTLSKSARIKISVYNMLGRRVSVLADQHADAGTYQAEWSGNDDLGRPVESGVYLLKLEADGRRFTRKLILIR